MARKTVSRNIAYDETKQCYYVTFHYGTDASGRRVKRTRTYHDLGVAQTALRQFEQQRHRLTVAHITMEVTLEEWLHYWLEKIVKPNREKSTIYGYENIIRNHVVPELGSTPLYCLEAVQIQRYYTRMLDKGLSPNSIRKHHILLHTALNTAVRQKVLMENCIDSVVPPQVTEPKHYFYDAQQLHQLFRLAEGHPLELAVKLAGYLGLRRSEICGLKWDAVDLERGVLFICAARTAVGGVAVDKGPKTASSERHLSIGAIPDLRQLLERRWEEQCRQRELLGEAYNPGNYVLVTAEGVPYQPDYVSGWFSRFIRRHRLPPLTLHGLRHSFASVANSQRIPLFDIGKALGHSNTTTTSRIYTHLFDDTHRDMLSQVAGAIANDLEEYRGA